MYVLVSMRSWCTAYARHRSLCLLRLCSLYFFVSCGALPEGMAVTSAAILAGSAAQNNMQEYRCSLHKRCRCQCGACTTSPQVTAGRESASVEFCLCARRSGYPQHHLEKEEGYSFTGLQTEVVVWVGSCSVCLVMLGLSEVMNFCAGAIKLCVCISCYLDL